MYGSKCWEVYKETRIKNEFSESENVKMKILCAVKKKKDRIRKYILEVLFSLIVDKTRERWLRRDGHTLMRKSKKAI